MKRKDHEAAEPATGDIPPWELPCNFRLDYRPHRGPLLRRLANTAFLLTVACYPGLCLLGRLALCAGLLGAGLGLLTWALARHDLDEMHAGIRDPAGEGETSFARKRAAWSVIIGSGSVLGAGCLLLQWSPRLLTRWRF